MPQPEQLQNPKVSWHIPWDASISASERWVTAELLPGLAPLRCWLQAKTVDGKFWVQFDSDGPYRLVDSVTHL